MIPKRRLKFPQPNGLRLTTLKNPPQRRQFPVERSNAGQALNNLPQHCSSRLAAPRCATASGGAVQTLERSALQKVRDVVGLYLDPPDRALVLCVDEKSQIQALDRPGPILEKELPADQEVHLIMDNCCTHKSAEVQRWLKPKKRKRFHFHFTPTSSSWLNEVERFFALITGRMIRRGTFHSAEELEKAIYRCLASWNGDPTPFVWKASADVILDKVRRCKELSKTRD